MSYLSINEAALNSVVEEVVEQAVENAVSGMSIESSVECQIDSAVSDIDFEEIAERWVESAVNDIDFEGMADRSLESYAESALEFSNFGSAIDRAVKTYVENRLDALVNERVATLFTNTLGKYVEFLSVCPEVESGFPVPREPFRLVGEPEAPRLVPRQVAGGPRPGRGRPDRGLDMRARGCLNYTIVITPL